MLAVDGKTVRGARAEEPAPHLMACLDHGSGVVRAQVAVDGKTSEIPMSPAAGPIGLPGAVVTADALHAQRDTPPTCTTAAATTY